MGRTVFASTRWSFPAKYRCRGLAETVPASSTMLLRLRPIGEGLYSYLLKSLLSGLERRISADGHFAHEVRAYAYANDCTYIRRRFRANCKRATEYATCVCPRNAISQVTTTTLNMYIALGYRRHGWWHVGSLSTALVCARVVEDRYMFGRG